MASSRDNIGSSRNAFYKLSQFCFAGTRLVLPTIMFVMQMGMGAISQAENGETRVSQRGDVTVETLSKQSRLVYFRSL